MKVPFATYSVMMIWSFSSAITLGYMSTCNPSPGQIEPCKTLKYLYHDSSLRIEIEIRKISKNRIHFKINSSDIRSKFALPDFQGNAEIDQDSPIGLEDPDLNTIYGWTRYRYTDNKGCNGVILINSSAIKEYNIKQEDRLLLDNDCIRFPDHTLKLMSIE
jgi:hypothetical protein